jgi:hypothetical protein
MGQQTLSLRFPLPAPVHPRSWILDPISSIKAKTTGSGHPSPTITPVAVAMVIRKALAIGSSSWQENIGDGRQEAVYSASHLFPIPVTIDKHLRVSNLESRVLMAPGFRFSQSNKAPEGRAISPPSHLRMSSVSASDELKIHERVGNERRKVAP